MRSAKMIDWFDGSGTAQSGTVRVENSLPYIQPRINSQTLT